MPPSSTPSTAHKERRGEPVRAALVPLLPLAVGALALAFFAPFETPAGRVLAIAGLSILLGASAALQLARERSRERRRVPSGTVDDPQRARSAILAAVGHELRTPLGTILGMTDLAAQTPLTPEQREYVDAAHRAARQLQGLVDDLLDLSQLDGGTLRLHEVAFSLPSLVGDTVRAFVPPAREKGLELLCEIDPDTPDGVRGDPARLRQVLTLLLDNALKFTAEGRVTVRLRRAAGGERRGRLALSVSDTGLGVAVEDRARIFEPLTQTDATATRRAGGAGLGLALGARLVKTMGGEIHLASQPGQGSTFRVELPLDEDPSGKRPTPQDLEALHGQQALVLDGEPTSRKALGELLGGMGVRPLLTDDPLVAREALAQAAGKGSPFALMIIDPRVRGSVVFRAQRAEDDPIVATTPRVLLESPGDPGWGGRTGPSPRLSRPVTRPEVVVALRRALAEPTRPSGAAARAGLVEPLRVLVAEDNWVNAFMASRMLERLGHRAEVVGDGAQAVAAVERGDFEVVLMDLQMPEMDGLEATRKIRAGERGTGRRVKVIAVTAFSAESELGRCQAAGMDGLLPKPFTLEALTGILTPPPAQTASVDDDRAEIPDPADARVFDLERLATQLGDDPEAVTEILESFVRDTPATLAQLRQAVAAGDATRVERAAHRLKGSLLWITAETAATHAATLESQARAGDLKTLQQPLEALDREVGRVLEEAARRADSAPS